jgi:hypothetical protein
MPEIDNDSLVSRSRRRCQLQSIGRLCGGLAELSEPKVIVDMQRQLVERICGDRISTPKVQEGGQASALGVPIKQQR